MTAATTPLADAPRRPRLAAAALAYALAYAAVCALCLPFTDGARPYPEWLTLVGRWVPALGTLAALALVPAARRATGGLTRAWGLRTRWRPLVAGIATAVVLFLAIAFVPVLVGERLGWVELKPWSIVGPALVGLPLYLVIGALSTLGEEVAWRAWFPRVLGGRFWPVALLVAVGWAAWHVPQLGMFVARGEVPAREMVVGLVGIAFWSLPLSALAARFRSVWPAVVGHALPFRAGSLAAALPAGDVAFWSFAALEWVLYAAAALAIAPRRTPSAQRP